MKKFLFTLFFAFGVVVACYAQKPVDFRINSEFGFSDPEGYKDIVVNFPGKTAHEIYTMMATNIGILFYEPEEVMYGVPDVLISISSHSSDFCRNGNQVWGANYHLKFIIKNGKVLILNPTIRNLKENNKSSLSSQKLEFVDFINKYWYNQNLGQFVASESDNMSLCEKEINRTVNIILGITPMTIVPKEW